MDGHILIVDDDPQHANLLAFLLADAGHRPATLADPRAIAAFLRDHAVDLVLLGAAPTADPGFEVCARLRADHPDTPIVLLAGRGTAADVVRGLNQGADDCIVKPYEVAELLARVAAVLRRYRHLERGDAGTLVRAGGASLDLGRLSFSADPSGPPVVVTPTEMRLLECLMRSPNTVVPREKLIWETWGYESDNADNRIDVHIRRLRRKIGAHPKGRDLILTVRGVGYAFRAESRRASTSA